MARASEHFDVAVIGAGPAGCAAALAFERRGASVLLLEANPDAADRLAGEWLHPRGVEALRTLGFDPLGESFATPGHGFVVHPGDGSEPIRLRYPESRLAMSGEHRALVDALRREAASRAGIVYRAGARVREVGPERLLARWNGDEQDVRASLVVGADGRASHARTALGLPAATTTVSRMAGLLLRDVDLPCPAYGHVFLGGPGPMLAYRVSPTAIRLCVDVPLGLSPDRATLLDAYAPLLPASLRPAFRRAAVRDDVRFASNQVRARRHMGQPGLALVGDAVGFRHPLTAVGMTLGIEDAATLAEAPDFETWVQRRKRDTRVAEMLGDALYDVFSAETEPAEAIRAGMQRLWREDPASRVATMRFIGAEPGQLAAFSRTFLRVTGRALAGLGARAARTGRPALASEAARDLAGRAAWLLRAARGRPAVTAPERPAAQRREPETQADVAVQRAAAALIGLQGRRIAGPSPGDVADDPSGGWEGEVVWCPMLAAQYVIFCAARGIEIAPERREGLLAHFARTQQPSGLWGLHALSPPYLFVTALVYTASRLLGVDADAPELARARAFVRREGLENVPSWGKLWLAIARVYDWRGVPPVVPELWQTPTWLPVHPSRFYCHTRHIYLAMSVVYARRRSAPASAVTAAIRNELMPEPLSSADWTRARQALRGAEIVTPPSRVLRLAYRAAGVFERLHSPKRRERLLRDLERRIVWELRATDHTSLSPVSGLLNVLALGDEPAHAGDAKRAVECLEAWIWHDARDGTRVAGARSASWDTAFALRALGEATRHCTAPDLAAEVERSVGSGAAFLRRQQIRSSPIGFQENFRIDPAGGWCFASGWHGWPVSDCTAEAVEALLTSPPGASPQRAALAQARDFVLRCQNPDGGFGSYEARRTRLDLEWLNPAEMFGDSMSEHSYVECTASCVAALAALEQRDRALATSETRSAIARGAGRLRALQLPSGAWRGVWGVHHVYGTLFGIRGLRAAGATPSDPALRRACAWLLARQRPDGGFAESHAGCARGEYVAGTESQVVQTAWALMALLEAAEPRFDALSRAARFLVDRQQEDGGWPRQDPAGLFFRTALLEYDHYRRYFPLWALAAYETRRATRSTDAAADGPAADDGAIGREAPARRTVPARDPSPTAARSADRRCGEAGETGS